MFKTIFAAWREQESVALIYSHYFLSTNDHSDDNSLGVCLNYEY